MPVAKLALLLPLLAAPTLAARSSLELHGVRGADVTAVIAKEAGQNCDALSQSEVRTCKKVESLEACRAAAEELGMVEPTFHTFPQASTQYPGGCSLRSNLDGKPHLWWNSDSNSLPARKLAQGSVGWMPICTCTSAAPFVPVKINQEDSLEASSRVASKDEEEVFEEDGGTDVKPASTSKLQASDVNAAGPVSSTEQKVPAQTTPTPGQQVQSPVQQASTTNEQVASATKEQVASTTKEQEASATKEQVATTDAGPVQHVQLLSEEDKPCPASSKDGLTCGTLPTKELCQAAAQKLYKGNAVLHTFPDPQSMYPAGCSLRSTFDKKPHVWWNPASSGKGARQMANGSLGWVPICGCYKA